MLAESPMASSLRQILQRPSDFEQVGDCLQATRGAEPRGPRHDAEWRRGSAGRRRGARRSRTLVEPGADRLNRRDFIESDYAGEPINDLRQPQRLSQQPLGERLLQQSTRGLLKRGEV